MHPSLKRAANAWLWTKPFYRASSARRQRYTWAVNSRIRISDEHRFIYIRIPKAANTMLSHTLYHHSFGEQAVSNSAAKNAFKRPGDLKAGEIEGILRDYYAFIFVREPYERVLSAYLSKVRSTTREKKRYRDYVKWRLGLTSGDGVTFAQFCDYLRRGGVYDDPHWLPQSCFADMIGLENINYIGKVETLETDFAQVFGTIFPDQGQINFSTKTGSRNKSGDHVAAHYDDSCREIVRDLYARDFEAFGYPAD